MKAPCFRLAVAVVLFSSALHSQWVRMEGISGNVSHFARSQTSLFAATDWDGVFRLASGGTVWTRVDVGLSNAGIFGFAANEMSIFAGSSGTLYRSNDNGTTWDAILEFLPTWIIPAIACDGQRVIVGAFHGESPGLKIGRVFLSGDNGTTWDTTDGDFKEIEFVFADGPVLYASSYADRGRGGETIWSLDSGTTWVPVGAMLTDRLVYCMYSGGMTTFAGTDSGLFAKAYRSTPVPWVQIGMPGVRVMALTTGEGGMHGIAWQWEPTHPQYYLFSQTASFSTINDSTWIPLDWHGFPHDEYVANDFIVDVSDLLVCGSGFDYGDTVIAGGVWRRPLSEIVASANPFGPDVPHTFFLHHNYPNPFNPSTTIRYELPKSSMVRLSVYDMLGREVSLLVNERKNAGSYDVRFDAAGLSSGVYLYRLQAGDFTQTRRLLLLR